MTGKSIKIPKSSFKRRLYHTSNNAPGALFGHYLAGLIEGDGSIIVPKTVRNQYGKLLYPVVKITFVSPFYIIKGGGKPRRMHLWPIKLKKF